MRLILRGQDVERGAVNSSDTSSAQRVQAWLFTLVIFRGLRVL